jgi:hypothetical protein
MIRHQVITQNVSLENNSGLSKDEVLNFLPPGWHKFIQVIFESANICQVKIHTLDIKNGTLYVRSEGVHLDTFNRVARTIMMDSALTCMICGSYGRRRKDESGSPPLCGAHYLDYINEE